LNFFEGKRVLITGANGFLGIYCKIETDKVAKKIPQFCNYEFPTIAKGH